MELGKKLVKIRKSNKLTQDDLANKYYVTRQTISNWENGKSYPDLETLVKISNDFNISLDVLLKEDDKMIKDITDKQKKYESSKIVILLINIMAIICLIYFGFIYIIHDETIPNPNAMLAGPRWDTAGFALVLGIIPMLIVNKLAYDYSELKNKKIKLLFFIPSVICIILASHYLFLIPDEGTYSPEPSEKITLTCTSGKKEYEYDIYTYEDTEEVELAMDAKDKIDLGKIDQSNKESTIKTLTEYYKGNCEIKK